MSRLSNLKVDMISEARGRINWAIKPGDHMLQPAQQKHYEQVGESAMRVVFASLLLCNRESPRSILDFGCGSGRVTRWFRAAFPEAIVEASDVRSDSLEFLKTQLGVPTWLSSPDLSIVTAPRKYDLIWSGSVLTHLPEQEASILISKFLDWLNPGGLAVFTTHGRRAVSNMMSKRLNYVPADRVTKMHDSYQAEGFAFEPFEEGSRLGCSFSKLEWLLRHSLSPSVRLVTLSEAAWDKHQDVVALQLSDPEFRMT